MTSETARMEEMTIEAIADVLAEVIHEQLVALGDDIKGISWLSVVSDEYQPVQLPLAA